MRLKTDDFMDPQDYFLRRPRRLSRAVSKAMASIVVVGCSGLIAVHMLSTSGSMQVKVERASGEAPEIAPKLAAQPVIVPLRHAELLDPEYSLGAPPVAFGRNVGLRTQFTMARAPAAVVAAQAEANVETDRNPDVAGAAAELPLPAPRPTDLAILDQRPAPPPRPPEFSPASDQAPARAMSPRLARAPASAPTIAQAAPSAGGPSFFERLFGAREPGRSVLAYAAPEDGAVGDFSGAGRSGFDRYTAIYDISARTVYLPNGARLEAHSGLGEMMDDPRHVNVRMRGATPPTVYDLREREALFHGVRALRLLPVSGGTYGRAGLLAHTYMLGPSGQSNGCVSFRNYDAFLQAYLNGRVKRLAVVAKL